MKYIEPQNIPCVCPRIWPPSQSFVNLSQIYSLLPQFCFNNQSKEMCVSHSAVSNSLRPHGLQPTRLLCPRNYPDKNTGILIPFSIPYSIGHSLLQEVFLTQELNPGLLHCRQTLYHLSHHGSLLSEKNSIKILNILFSNYLFKDTSVGASPVAQWQRTHLPRQGTRIRSLTQEDPT